MLTSFVPLVWQSFRPSYNPFWTWQVQEVYLTTSLDQEGVKKAVQRVLGRVPWVWGAAVFEQDRGTAVPWLCDSYWNDLMKFHRYFDNVLYWNFIAAKRSHNQKLYIFFASVQWVGRHAMASLVVHECSWLNWTVKFTCIYQVVFKPAAFIKLAELLLAEMYSSSSNYSTAHCRLLF
jgi:hypothetical protein